MESTETLLGSLESVVDECIMILDVPSRAGTLSADRSKACHIGRLDGGSTRPGHLR